MTTTTASLPVLLDTLGYRLDRVEITDPKRTLWDSPGITWKVTLANANDGRTLATPYAAGTATREVTLADVAHCLLLDAQSAEDSLDVADFLTEFGYVGQGLPDPASALRDGIRAFEAIRESAPRTRAFFGADFDALAAAAADY